jgi:multimeric flavodoxin WrbA
MTTVLGVSASLRNARFGRGSHQLCDDIKGLTSREALLSYLEKQTTLRADDLFAAAQQENLAFDQVYAQLRKAHGDRGLSNSEAALAAGLWGACEGGADISHCGLATYFTSTGEHRNLEELRSKVLKADAILLSGPVYFGDRGSPAQAFIDFLREDPICASHIRNRLYAGIAVGAKRNGGQETTLIYQLVDMTNLNMLVVGNDSSTTSQYGGTAVAGDIGTLSRDAYGIDTAIGTGMRLARVSKLLERGTTAALHGDVRIAVWLLQDDIQHRGRILMEGFCNEVEESVKGISISVLDFSEEQILPCIACDVCPTERGARDDYRCIITARKDLFRSRHSDLISPDAILLGAYSPVKRSSVRSVYQQFIERTRYLRRDDYALGDILVAPFVISEVNSNQNLHIRMLTSFIRHSTVLHHPIIGIEHENKLLNPDTIIEQGIRFAHNAVKITTGRLSTNMKDGDPGHYRPVGYLISERKFQEDEATGRLKESSEQRQRESLELSQRLQGRPHSSRN